MNLMSHIKVQVLRITKNLCYNPHSGPSYKPYSSSMDEYSCSAVEEEFTKHSSKPPPTDLETKEKELIALVLESPK